MNKYIAILIVVVLAGAGAYFFLYGFPSGLTNPPQETVTDTETQDVESADDKNASQIVIGKSVEGRDIVAYNYGRGQQRLLFVGGMHGGYSWNTALVAYELMDYLKANPQIIPSTTVVTVIPVLNPDGLNKVVGTTSRFAISDVPSSQSLQVLGRFNANKVDLNRNFDCDWQTEGTWKNTAVSGGSEVFSEPESKAFRDYVKANRPMAAVVWYSAAGGVFASNCHNGVTEDTRGIMNTYAKASGYPAYESFDFYEITGDMVNWLAKNRIPAISVLLSTHTNVEWDKNRAGVDALIKYLAK